MANGARGQVMNVVGENRVRGAIRIGVLGCADIAWRRMLPAFLADRHVDIVAVASRTGERAAKFAAEFGCAAVVGYQRLLDRDDIDAVYVPLPPGLHATWIRRALEGGRHVLTEKPATTSAADTAELVALATADGLALMENVMFLHHSRHGSVQRLLAGGAVGEVRGLHSTFTIPARPAGDIRLSAGLGGGALLDNGAYPVRAAQLLLGPDLTVAGAHLTMHPTYGVDIAGSALLYRSDGVAAQLTFGMDHHYVNDYHVLGSSGRIDVGRAFTPPADLTTEITVARQGGVERVSLPAEDQCATTVAAFVTAVRTGTCPDAGAMLRQATLIDEIREHSRRSRS